MPITAIFLALTILILHVLNFLPFIGDQYIGAAALNVNINALRGIAPGSTISYALPGWRFFQIGLDVLAAALLGLLVWLNIRRARDEREHPENYKPFLTRKERRAAKKAARAERRLAKQATR